jgi:hypothetical protein
MTETTIVEARASGEEIEFLVNEIENVLAGKPRHHVLMALISMSLIAMNPMITAEALATGVRDVSRFICMLMEEPTILIGDTEKAAMN